MIKITLSEQEHRQLEDMFKTTEGRLRTRCQAILMAHRGRQHRHIAEDLGVTVRTLQRWLRAYQGQRLAGLQLRWRPVELSFSTPACHRFLVLVLVVAAGISEAIMQGHKVAEVLGQCCKAQRLEGIWDVQIGRQTSSVRTVATRDVLRHPP